MTHNMVDVDQLQPYLQRMRSRRTTLEHRSEENYSAATGKHTGQRYHAILYEGRRTDAQEE